MQPNEMIDAVVNFVQIEGRAPRRHDTDELIFHLAKEVIRLRADNAAKMELSFEELTAIVQTIDLPMLPIDTALDAHTGISTHMRSAFNKLMKARDEAKQRQ